MQLLHHEFHFYHFDNEQIQWMEWIAVIVLVTIVGALIAVSMSTTGVDGTVITDPALMELVP